MNKQSKLVFTRQNYLLMFVGIGLIIVGLILMSLETAPYGFGTLGLTLGPIVIMAGFIVEFFAIFYKPKSKDGLS